MIGWNSLGYLLRDTGADPATLAEAGREAAWESVHFPAIHVQNAWRVWQEALLREADARARVGAGGMSYDSGGLGVRIQTTPGNGFERGMVELVDAGQILTRACDAYWDAEEGYVTAIKSSGLSDREKDILMLRYLRGGRSYARIAAKMGFRTTSGARKAVMRAEDRWVSSVYERTISPVLRWIEERRNRYEKC